MLSTLAWVWGVRFVQHGTTLYLRGMPEDLVREAKAAAARRGVTIAALVTDALKQVVGRETSDEGRPEDRRHAPADHRLAQSMRWFEANRARLVRTYRDQYVAIDRSRVIDHDRDFDALARRVFARLGARPVFMPKVTAKERIVNLPSPFIAGS